MTARNAACGRSSFRREAAWISPSSPIVRMDIGLVSWRGAPLGWQSPAGFAAPSQIDPESDGGTGFNRGFSGFLITCGLDHIRSAGDGRPQHGRLPFTPAKIKSYGEDWTGSSPSLHCAGEVTQARYGAEALRLMRRIEAPIGGGEIRILDVVENVGATTVPQPMLYHFNLGYPAIVDGTTVSLDDKILLGPLSLADAERGLTKARSWPVSGAAANCTVRSPSGLSVRFAFAADTLGHLQLWHDLRPNVGVLSIEPCTSERRVDDAVSEEALIEPGERRTYSLTVSFEGNASPALLGEKS